MNRTRWLILTIVLLVAANIAHHIWKDWGLITIHCEDWPVGTVVHEIERQGHVTVKSNVPGETKVRMHVDKVPIAEALATLSVVTEARWRLAYFYAGDRMGIEGALGAFAAGNKPEGWKTQFFPVPRFGNDSDDGPQPDPRRDVWTVRPADPGTAQSYLDQAARSVAAAFYYPETWNPPVKSAPESGPIAKAAPHLAKAAGGKVLEVFLLEANRRRAEGTPRVRGNGDDEEATRIAFRKGMEERTQAEIAKLPPAQREAALREIAERRALADASPEERRAKVQEYLQRDDVQERFSTQNTAQQNRMTPQQRLQHAQKYIQNKQAMKNAAQ